TTRRPSRAPRPRCGSAPRSRGTSSRSRRSSLSLRQRRRVVRRDLALRELAQDLLAALGLPIRLRLRWEPERPDDRVQPRSDRRVRDAELALDVLEVASRADERLEELELIRGQRVEPAQGEVALEPGAAGLALEAHDPKRFVADRATADDRIRHI